MLQKIWFSDFWKKRGNLKTKPKKSHMVGEITELGVVGWSLMTHWNVIQSPGFLLSMTLGDTTCKSELPLLAGEFNSASSPLHEIVEAKRVMIYVKSKRKSKHARFLSSPPDCELLEEGTLHLSTQSDCCIVGRHLYRMINTNYEPDGPEKENCFGGAD